MKIIDCRGLACPAPVIETKKYFENIESGEAVVLVDNEIANTNIKRLAESLGYISNSTIEEEIYKIVITKKLQKKESEDKDTFSIIITTDKMGEGDEKLGTMLMKSYMYALSEATEIPDELIFLNSGVKLVTEGTDVIESIKELERKGTKVISCGACLDFYNLKENLLTGEIGNMYAIVEIMNSKRVIKI